jgi:hypothetical protein
MRLPIDHSTILREYRSSTTARYNQPSVILMNVISAAHTRFGLATLNCRTNRFSATGKAWPESVVFLKRRSPRPQRLADRISRRTAHISGPQLPVRPGGTVRPLPSSCTVPMCARSCTSLRCCRPVATKGTCSRSYPGSDSSQASSCGQAWPAALFCSRWASVLPKNSTRRGNRGRWVWTNELLILFPWRIYPARSRAGGSSTLDSSFRRLLSTCSALLY